MSAAARLLRSRLRGEVDDSSRRRAEYSSDASNYRVVPEVVVFPRDAADVVAAVEVCRATSTPLTTRGGGTSVAGNAVGSGVVLDLSRHLNRVVGIDVDARTAVVEPGAVLDDLQRQAAPHGLRFGPDPSTHARCTLGGMIGNNACGARALRYGRTADNVLALDVVDGTGRRFTAGRGTAGVPGLSGLVRGAHDTIRTELGRFARQVSGYSLEHLLPERGTDLAKALVGSEGTCGVVLGATVQLVEVPPATALAVLAFPDMAAAADAVPHLLAHRPVAVEGMDARLVEAVRAHRGSGAVAELPAGQGWLFVEVAGEDDRAATAAAHALCADAPTGRATVVPAGTHAAALWRIREEGAGLAGRTPTGAPAWPAWEDAAVPPAVLGPYLRDFRALLDDHGLDGVAYGHFGDGCVHVRLDLPLRDRPDRLRPFLLDAAALAAGYGGSLSGEHGDGRARSELLPTMYSKELIGVFESFKGCFDPDDVLNPGVLVHPRPVDADLRLPAARSLPTVGGFALSEDGGDLTTAVHRCVGLGVCRADIRPAGGVMCPSFTATRDERDSTRGRARVLQEMANGELVTGGPASPAVHDVLDLCLACKACASDCPAGVDMATYKAEVLHRTYRRRPRPRAHYALGQLPRWARVAGLAPGLANGALRLVAPVAKAAAGIDRRRPLPRFVRPFRRDRRQLTRGGDGIPVVLWVDTFTDGFAPQVAHAAVAVLEDAGHDVAVAAPACCGLTWITTGQLTGARRRLRRLLDVLGPAAAAGTPIVGLEPSCTAVLRDDLVELLPDDPRAAAVASATRTLAEVLDDARGRGWATPRLDGVQVVAQPHCHQHAVMGFDADRRLLTDAGAAVQVLGGCCGLAGNFGMERGHYDVSVEIAAGALLPGLDAAPPDAVLLADGFSCRTQAAHLADAEGQHLAELLAGHLTRPEPGAAATG